MAWRGLCPRSLRAGQTRKLLNEAVTLAGMPSIDGVRPFSGDHHMRLMLAATVLASPCSMVALAAPHGPLFSRIDTQIETWAAGKIYHEGTETLIGDQCTITQSLDPDRFAWYMQNDGINAFDWATLDQSNSILASATTWEYNSFDVIGLLSYAHGDFKCDALTAATVASSSEGIVQLEVHAPLVATIAATLVNTVDFGMPSLIAEARLTNALTGEELFFHTNDTEQAIDWIGLPNSAWAEIELTPGLYTLTCSTLMMASWDWDGAKTNASAFVNVALSFQDQWVFGDVNLDGAVNDADKAALMAVAHTDNAAADLNADGTVDRADWAILLDLLNG
jgi:hypothetical protein